ncbi:D-alanyl-D-alanine carboxypeptidase [Candidatus Curtissbacteria bacterium]|nr:D-alanyl-D-alanine carboxypeptidase [Candidatus Curtissbacteria bacterium]
MRFFLSFLALLILAGFSSLVLREKNFSIDSPVPKVFESASFSQLVSNLWFPKEQKNLEDLELSLTSKSALLLDYDTGEVIFSKNPKERLPVASTVKIMTALSALESGKLSDVYTVSRRATEVGENTMYLTVGEKLTLEELLYGLMLVSGNDAAVTIAEGIAGSEEKFVQLMNAKVAELGLSDTKFINATGLDEDDLLQYSTAYDLSVIARYVWENYPQIREITSTYHKFIEANDFHKSFDLYNDTNLLTTYPGVKGIKPGFTWEAGLCLVTYSENGGKRLLAVVLGSDDRRGEMTKLLDYGFGTFGIKVEHPGLDL